jgi:hypothetical protein
VIGQDAEEPLPDHIGAIPNLEYELHQD